MNHSEKLEALVQTGFDRAWEFDNLDKWEFKAVKKTDTVRTDWWQVVFTHGDKTVVIDAERILFDPLFARALLGESEFTGLDAIVGSKDMFTGVERTHYWQYHLQQAVISDDPISYMYRVVFPTGVETQKVAKNEQK